MLVFLWTDIFIWLLLGIIIFLFVRLKSRPDFKIAFHKLSNSVISVVSVLILAIYIIIGLLDSIHYRVHIDNGNVVHLDHDIKEDVESKISQHYGEVKSVLDYILLPWSKHTEKTFSEPFATKSFVKERIVDNNGIINITYPNLDYVNELPDYHVVITSVLISAIIILSLLLLVKVLNHFNICSNYFNSCRENTSNKLAYYSFWITLTFILIIIFNMLYLYKYYHIFGTDKIGRDILYISLKSIRTGLVIGSLTTIFMVPLALLFGTLSGYFGGRTDDFIQYVYTTLSSIPGVLLISAFILILQTQIELHPDWFETLAEQADLRLLSLCIILGITSWSGLCRLVRAETLKIREMDYVVAAKTMRVTNIKIILRHVIPNLAHIVIINVAISFSGLVLAEAVLSYIGVGVDPTTMSWGNMINSARLQLSRDPIVWWPIIGAFIPMSLFVLVLNLFADKLRDAFDPRALR